jgi:N-carbamoyl-L-amino-acid hydrolase
MYREAQEASQRFAVQHGCTVDWSRIWSIEPIPFHPDLIALSREAIEETAPGCPSLPSGPLHDAAEVARIGIPTVMMFTQSLRGISHNKIEDTSEAHLRLAVSAFDRLAHKTLAWLGTR